MNNWRFQTKAIHSGFDQDPATGATALPIFQTASFAHADAQDLSDIFNGRKFGYSYSRIANPTVTAFENHITALENGLASVALASGMGAIASTLLALLSAGDEIVASKSIFGGTYYLLKEFEETHQVKVHFVQPQEIEEFRKAVTEKTRLIFCETIGNPKLDVPDIQALAAIANEANIPLVVDSTTTTPYLFKAKDFGVSVVLHSATKWMSGSGSTIGGVVVDLGNFKWQTCKSPSVLAMSKKMGDLGFIARCKKIRSNFGAPLSPLSAFLLNLGLDTLVLRMDKQCENALAFSKYFSGHSKIKELSYPGLPNNPFHDMASKQFLKFGGLLTLRLGSKEACFDFINKLKLIKNLANLGDAKTLIIHPDSTIYRDLSREEKDSAGAYEDLLRLSLGLEDIADLIDDVEGALS